MTDTQQQVLATLRARGAYFTAEAAERNWGRGRMYYLDARNPARRGLVRLFDRANSEAVRGVAQ